MASGFEDAHNFDDVLATYGTFCEYFAALDTAHHVTTIQEDTINCVIHTDFAYFNGRLFLTLTAIDVVQVLAALRSWTGVSGWICVARVIHFVQQFLVCGVGCV